MHLSPFDQADASVVAGWVRSDDEASLWASVQLAAVSPAMFEQWHVDADVHPFVLRDDDGPRAYGEVWVDHEEDEAELARLVVDPQWRGRGVGRRLTELLARDARGLGFDDVWLRVVPHNTVAIACYRGAGFVRASAEVEQAFNSGQPREYVWMRFSPA